MYPVLSEKTLEDRICDLVEKEQTGEILRTLKHVYEQVFAQRKREPEYQTEAFREVFGEHPGKDYYECVSPANVDLICANIFESGRTTRSSTMNGPLISRFRLLLSCGE